MPGYETTFWLEMAPEPQHWGKTGEQRGTRVGGKELQVDGTPKYIWVGWLLVIILPQLQRLLSEFSMFTVILMYSQVIPTRVPSPQLLHVNN